MVDGDEGGEDGGEDGLRIPPSGEESWINLSPKNKDRGGGGALFRENSSPPRAATFSYI